MTWSLWRWWSVQVNGAGGAFLDPWSCPALPSIRNVIWLAQWLLVECLFIRKTNDFHISSANCQKRIQFSGFCLNIVVNQWDVFVWSLHLAVFGLSRETWRKTGWIFYLSCKCFSSLSTWTRCALRHCKQLSALVFENWIQPVRNSIMLFGTTRPWIIQLICTIVICTLWVHRLWKYFCNYATPPIQGSLEVNVTWMELHVSKGVRLRE